MSRDVSARIALPPTEACNFFDISCNHTCTPHLRLMLNCRACPWRCIRALDTTSPQSQRFRHNVIVAPFTGQQRFLRTATNNIRKVDARPTHLSSVETLSKTKSEPWHRSAQAIDQKQQERATLRRRPADNDERGKEADNSDMWWGKRDPRMPTKEWNARRRELQYLKDPLEVAGFVKKELGKDKATEMLQLVRMASHSMQVVVSWNHLVDYYMAKERVSEALKVYNEVSCDPSGRIMALILCR
jgi:pentatricopeptide repeat protein